MSTVVLIGTSHKYQCATDGALSNCVAEFRSEVEKLCRAYAIAALAEEMNLDGLTYQGASESVLQQISTSLNFRTNSPIRPRPSDPSLEFAKTTTYVSNIC
ncbi:MAG TPA: hypothetical protein VFF16_11190 [Telluria sp.]|nr:hypothetical protein [Telluria sp.]